MRGHHGHGARDGHEGRRSHAQGAFNFLEKPITPNQLRAITEKAAQAVSLRQTNVELRRRLDEKFGFEGLVYSGQNMQWLIDRLKRVAPTDATVLITGESGTGKELVARAIHQNSPARTSDWSLSIRARSPRISWKANSSDTSVVPIPMRLPIAKERFNMPMGYALLLDEFGDMPMSTQIKLLRVLEEHSITESVTTNRSRSTCG